MEIPLPSYVDKDAWLGFCEMRKAMPKARPFTTRAAVLILKELQKLKDAGHDPNEALDQSTLHGWMDVYQPKVKEIERAADPASDRIRRELDQLDERKTKPPADLRARVMSNLRRVA